MLRKLTMSAIGLVLFSSASANAGVESCDRLLRSAPLGDLARLLDLRVDQQRQIGELRSLDEGGAGLFEVLDEGQRSRCLGDPPPPAPEPDYAPAVPIEVNVGVPLPRRVVFGRRAVVHERRPLPPPPGPVVRFERPVHERRPGPALAPRPEGPRPRHEQRFEGPRPGPAPRFAARREPAPAPRFAARREPAPAPRSHRAPPSPNHR